MNPSNARPEFDAVISDIARYVDDYEIDSALARETAHYCLIDSLGCAFEALAYPECTKLLGPVVPGTDRAARRARARHAATCSIRCTPHSISAR